jgi:hypothetical protein
MRRNELIARLKNKEQPINRFAFRVLCDAKRVLALDIDDFAAVVNAVGIKKITDKYAWWYRLKLGIKIIDKRMDYMNIKAEISLLDDLREKLVAKATKHEADFIHDGVTEPIPQLKRQMLQELSHQQ